MLHLSTIGLIPKRMMGLGLAGLGWIASKVRWFFDLLYGGPSAEFESAFDIDESVKRLSAVTREFPIFTRERVAQGEASKYFVSICKPCRPFDLRPGGFSPYFEAEFSKMDGRVKLSGRFELFWLTKVFFAIWLGFTILWTGIAARSVLLQGDLRNYWLPFVGIGFFAIGVTYIWFGRWCYRPEVTWLSSLIQDALSGGRPSEPQTKQLLDRGG